MPSSVTTAGGTANANVRDGDAIGIPHMQDVDDAAYRIGHSYPGRVPALAVRMGVNADTLAKKLNPNCETHRLSVADSVHLQVAAGRNDILYAMASSLDHVCIYMPDAAPDQVAMRLAKVGAEVGDVFRVAQQVMADGKIDAAERRELKAQIAEAVGALAAVLKGV